MPETRRRKAAGRLAPRPPALDRRRFLILAGGALAYGALRPHLALAKHAEQWPAGLQPWTLPSEPPANPIDLARAMIGAAVLAPSHWNAQPWRFEVEGNSIRVVADFSRALPATDPDRRAMTIGLGAALENLLIAARAWGLQPTVDYFPVGAAHPVVATVTWTEGGPQRDRPLFDMIPLRRTNRRDYDGRGIYPQNRAQLFAQISGDHQLHWLDDRDTLHDLGDLAHEASHVQSEDRRAALEQAAWMRDDDGDARRRGDGVTVKALEYPGLAHWMPGRAFDPDSWFHRFGVGSAAKQARSGFRSAGAAVLITTARRDPSTWVAGGQAFQRFALKTTQLGISHQPISAPIEVERMRGDLMKLFGAAGEEPLLLVRLGHANPPEASARRSVSVVSTFRNS
jgi:nitroreductase